MKMTLNYHRVWSTLNELESVTSKISSAREILDSAIDALENHKLEKTGTLLYAVNEFLQYYLEDFDRKFKDAWKETVTKLKQQEIDDCMPPWGHSDLEYLSKLPPEEPKQDKVIKWQLPVEEGTDCITGEKEYFISFPDDLLEAANLKRGDDVEWVDNNDGSFLLRKTTQPKTYDEMVAAGYTMTADGFWIKE